MKWTFEGHGGDIMPRWEVRFDPKINVEDRELIALHAEIESYRLSIMKIPLPPARIEELNQINSIRQIKGTTGIEGNNLTEDQIRKILEGGTTDRDVEKEAKNAADALEFIKKYVKEHGSNSGYISEELIRKLHELNMRDIAGPDNKPGKYRRENVNAGDYSAPEWEKVDHLMQQFVFFINHESVISAYGPLIRALLAHFYLITIHPFRDGNGRTSRALEAFILYSSGYNVRGFYSLANFHYKNREEYISQLNNSRFMYDGNLNEFVKYCMRAFLNELKWVQDYILEYVKYLTYKDFVLESFKIGLLNHRQFNVLQFMLDGMPLRIDEYKNKKNSVVEKLYSDVSIKTVQRDYKKLISDKFILEAGNMAKPNINIMDQFLV